MRECSRFSWQKSLKFTRYMFQSGKCVQYNNINIVGWFMTSEIWVRLKWWSIRAKYIPVSGTRMVLVGYLLIHIHFIWLIQRDGYRKNILMVKKSHFFLIFYYISIISLTFNGKTNIRILDFLQKCCISHCYGVTSPVRTEYCT
jgi:hypothetical protein